MRWLYMVLIAFVLSGCSGESFEDEAKKLGTRDFTVEAWAAASQEERGQMIASFMTKYRVQDLTLKQVKSLLGPATGYYDYDEYPAYLVGPKNIKSEYGKGYLWVFITDRDTGKVAEVVLVPKVEDI